MEEVMKRNKQIRPSQLEDVPDLFHRIQSFLPVKAAARTCVLSKAWLQAWSTIPDLKFRQMFASKQQRRKHLPEVVDRTLLRYIQHNIPLQTIDLEIDIETHDLASLAEKWIGQVATKTSLKDISLLIKVRIASFTLPDEMYLCKNLNKIIVRTFLRSDMNPLWMSSNNPTIKCVSLRVLKLNFVHITQEVLDNLLSTCTLLEEITLLSCQGFKTIKVKTLGYLSKVRIELDNEDHILEIDHVPNLRFFDYNSSFHVKFNMESLAGSVTKLWLRGVKLDDAFFDIIASKFHFLESLTLKMHRSSPKSFKITCVPLKRLFIHSWSGNHFLGNIQVFAPKLRFFYYDGMKMPRLEFFPASAPKKIKIKLILTSSLTDESFFSNILEALALSSKFDIDITMRTRCVEKPWDLNIDELIKRSVLFPATNVRQLSFQTISDKGLWDYSRFFDALFSICHPKKVVAIQDQLLKDSNYFCELMVREVMEKKNRKGYWTDYLKAVRIKNPKNKKWEKLTDSWKGFLDGSTQVDCYKVEFKLNWYKSRRNR